MKNIIEDLKAMMTSMMDRITILKSSLYQKGLPKDQDTIAVVLANRRSLPFDSGHYTKIVGMWNLKHEIISPKFCEILIKT